MNDVTPFINAVDVGAVLVLLLGMMLGRSRRLSGEIGHLVSVVAAFAAGLLGYRPLCAWFSRWEQLGPRGAYALAFVAAIVAAALLMVIIRIGLMRVIQVVLTEPADRTLGGLVGLVRGAILVTAIFILMNLMPSAFLNRQFGEASLIGRWVRKLQPTVEERLPFLEKKTDQLMEDNIVLQEEEPAPRRRRSR